LMLYHEEADTDAMPGQIAYTQMAEAFRLVPFAGSWHDALHNSLCVDVERGTIHAHVPPLGGAAPDYPWKPENAAVPGDVCEWFTEYARRVEAGVYRVAHDVEPFRLADMDPHASPDMVLSGPMMWRMPRVTGKTSISYEDRLYEHTSFGALRVTVGVAYTGIQPIDAPQYFNGPVHGQSIYAYEVSFTLLSEEEQRTAWEKGDSSIFGSSSSFQPIREARLKYRRWECEEVVYARARDRETDESFNHGDLDREIWSEPEIVEGEGVIGLTPTLTAGGDTFRYRSMTTVSRHPSHRVLAPLHEINKDCTWGVSLSGVMSGGFTFVAIPEGAREVEFVAQCPAFMCEAPQYVFG